LNEKLSEAFEKLSTIMTKKGDNFRSKAYKKAMEIVIRHPSDIFSPEDLKGIPGIGKSIMELLNEFANTGTISIIENEKTNPLNILTNVYGIGPKKAQELIEKGITTMDDLKNNLHELNKNQIIGVKYYKDLLERIPRTEIEKFEIIFKEVAEKIGIIESNISIVGSYRRGNESSGDIDVILTTDEPGKFIMFIDILQKQDIITEILSRGTSKCLVIGKINDKAFSRRIDFLFTNQEEYPYSILYFTGSKSFNVSMREHALTRGYTMNEHGLFKVNKKNEKNEKNEKIKHLMNEEKDIFDFLQLQFKLPVERVDYRDIVIKIN
jgi:DNA polymerase/3'-5' exonuclease PolX